MPLSPLFPLGQDEGLKSKVSNYLDSLGLDSNDKKTLLISWTNYIDLISSPFDIPESMKRIVMYRLRTVKGKKRRSPFDNFIKYQNNPRLTIK